MSELKALLQDWLQALLGAHADAAYDLILQLGAVFAPFLLTGARLWWPFLIAYVLISYLIYVFRDRETAGDRGFVAYVFPRQIYLHADAIRTYFLVFINGLIKIVIGLGTLIVSISTISIWTVQGLTIAFGPHEGTSVGLAVIALYSILILIVRDLGNWTVHMLFHKVPLLWEFHKVHHCPTVLTPITDKQFHPVELIAKGLGAALFVGPFIGMVNYAFLTTPQEFTLFDVAALMLVFNLFGNFRHSHIWIGFPRWLSFVVSSPAMHQIHHSQAPAHWDRNYAVIFSFWDYLFGTLYIPRSKEELEFGIADSPAGEFDSLLKLYARPFQRAWQMMISIGSRRAPAATSDTPDLPQNV